MDKPNYIIIMNKLNLTVLSLLLILVVSCKKNQEPFAVMAYYMPSTEENNLNNLPLDRLTHIIFSFTIVIDNQMQFSDAESGDQLKDLVKQKEKYPHLKVMVACGGWGGSGGFSEMATNVQNRQIFVTSCIQFLQEYDLDGLDIDWEYPGLPGIGNPHKPKDKEGFTALMKELRTAMNETGKKYTLTFASAGWEKYYDFVELDNVMPSVDYMNIMTYDFTGGNAKVTSHHTNLGLVTADDFKDTPAYINYTESETTYHPRSCQFIINYCINKGVKPEQIVIGAAFYGKGWVGVDPDNNGLYQQNKGGWPGARYHELKDNYINKNGFIRYWDETAKAPFLYSSQDSVFITYDDPESVALKTQYALNNKLGGIMFWQLNGDTQQNDLLNAIDNEVK